MEKESLHFKLGLSSSSKKQPEFAVYINDKEFLDTKISVTDNNIEYFEFDAEIEEGPCSLRIEFKNKLPEYTKINNNDEIVEDLLLNIDSIEIDEIDLGSLLWTASDYQPIYPEVYKQKMHSEGKELPKSVKNCVNLGWNGSWILPFTSPFYIWLLENL